MALITKPDLRWNRRRALVGKLPSHQNTSGRPHADKTRIVHVSQQDMEIHYQLNRSTTNVKKRKRQETVWPALEINIPIAWIPAEIEVDQQDLIQHFRHAASKSLAIFGRDPTELGNVLMRIALVKNTASATALFRSILAFSSLHRHGIHSRAIELKISAIKALAAASGSSLDAVEAMQHVAAGMLLSSFETHQATCTSGDWTRYLRGAKHVIDAAGLDELPHDDDLAALLDWVYYQDVLARFSVRHWHRDAQGKPAAESDVESVTGTLRAKASKAAPPALRLIELLSNVCDIISHKILEAISTDENKSYLRILEWRIRTTAITTTADDNDDKSEDATLITELYRLATLVYLHRASFEMPWPATRTQQLVDKGFCLLARLGACDRQFPIFVLGCEARSDEQRAVLLDLITRTERGPSSRSFNYTRALLQAIWAQDDLAATSREVGYLDKMSYVISCCKNLPTFA
ncbi:fungal-specific transcription factor domain-containing protein [Corynascus similis CBS 632.67]